MSLLNTLKKASIKAMDTTNPVAVMVGTITKLSPLEVNVDQRFILSADFLLVPERLLRYEVDLKHTHQYEDASSTGTATKTSGEALPDKIVIREGLQAGDRVLLLRVQGGQQFLVLDKVVG